MTGIGRGFALALAMLIGALSLTSLLAFGLQHHALEQQSGTAGYSPTMDAIVDPSGWPREDNPQIPDAPTGERGRSRQPAPSLKPGA